MKNEKNNKGKPSRPDLYLSLVFSSNLCLLHLRLPRLLLFLLVYTYCKKIYKSTQDKAKAKQIKKRYYLTILEREEIRLAYKHSSLLLSNNNSISFCFFSSKKNVLLLLISLSLSLLHSAARRSIYSGTSGVV